ncbi:MAG TPA: PAS domain-containing protein, partial [Candidatus Synoicihabitans sp.]|nr:PAS domain-containing protein [Candidatus Synoicihabitans sp.]
MTQPGARSSPSPASPEARDGAPALLTLDAQGQILQANNAAASLWQKPVEELVRLRFPQLFVLEVVSADPFFVDAQWEVMAATTMARPTALTIQPANADPRHVHVRLEEATGGSAAFFAIVTAAPPVTPATSPSSRPSLDSAAAADWGMDLLLASTALGFFDLHA